jgi:nickel-dependent lactate racemase
LTGSKKETELSLDETAVQMEFGASDRMTIEVEARQLALDFRPDVVGADLVAMVRHALNHPVDFPSFEQVVIPDDNVVLAVDPTTPGLALIVAEIWRVLQAVGMQPDQVRIVQCATTNPLDPRSQLPADIRESFVWIRHRSSDADTCGYLATSTSGERIYLARELLEADVVISVGAIGFDPLLGYRGTNSVFYPSLSDDDAAKKSRGQGHAELQPDNSRPLRQLADETAWLLGTQFTIQTIGNSRNGFSHLLAGAIESVFRRGCALLDQSWRAQLESRAEIVVASIDSENSTWADVGAALAVARNLVTRDGWIVVLSDLAEDADIGIRMVAAAEGPDDAIKPLRLETPNDLIPATQLVNAVNWGRVFLLSRLNPDRVEDLFCAPMQSIGEVERLLRSTDNPIAFISSAQNVYGEIVDVDLDEDEELI